MSTIRVSEEAEIGAAPETVYRVLADYQNHHPHVLPAAFSNFSVESGGVGAGTVIRFDLTTFGRAQSARQRIEEPEPGRQLQEVDLDRDLCTTFTVTPRGDQSHVRIETVWNEGGLTGLVMRLLAPLGLKPVYREELANVDRYARELQATQDPGAERSGT